MRSKLPPGNGTRGESSRFAAPVHLERVPVETTVVILLGDQRGALFLRRGGGRRRGELVFEVGWRPRILGRRAGLRIQAIEPAPEIARQVFHGLADGGVDSAVDEGIERAARRSPPAGVGHRAADAATPPAPARRRDRSARVRPRAVPRPSPFVTHVAEAIFVHENSSQRLAAGGAQQAQPMPAHLCAQRQVLIRGRQRRLPDRTRARPALPAACSGRRARRAGIRRSRRRAPSRRNGRAARHRSARAPWPRSRRPRP